MAGVPESSGMHRYLIIAAALVLTACVTHRPPSDDTAPVTSPDFDVEVTHDQVYVPVDWPASLAGDVYRPVGAGIRPGIVLIHGGGWTRRSRADMSELARKLARHGYVVFNVSYRFAPQYTFPAQVRDVQQAVRWLRRHADTFDLNIDQVAAYGYSSGAHLAAMVGLLSPGDGLFEPGTRLQALVLGGAPMDLRDYASGSLVPDFLGTDDAGDPLYVQASPVTLISDDDPPSFLYHGGLDYLVRPRYAKAAFEAMRQADINAELYIHHLREHVTMFVFGGRAEDAAIRFLDRHLTTTDPDQTVTSDRASAATSR